MDDKAKISVGDPGTPEAATSHMRNAVTTKNVVLESSDQNYHSVNVTPSVNSFCDIPDSLRDHAGPFEKVVSSCQSMKSLRAKEETQHGLRDAYLSSIENCRRLLEYIFSQLSLKGKKFKTFQPNNDSDEVLQSLINIEKKIAVTGIPHKRASLTEYPDLKKFFDDHLTEGLYMLQYGKCDNGDCCQLRNGPLPPPIPAPVLSPDKEHYLPFKDLYGKINTTERDCPSLKVKKDGKKKNQANYKFLASRVVAVVDCVLCGKTRCIFGVLQHSLIVKCQREIEDVMFSYGMQLQSAGVYTSRTINCSSPIESAFQNSTFGKQRLLKNLPSTTACEQPEGADDLEQIDMVVGMNSIN